jgi:hypothetical protein
LHSQIEIIKSLPFGPTILFTRVQLGQRLWDLVWCYEEYVGQCIGNLESWWANPPPMKKTLRLLAICCLMSFGAWNLCCVYHPFFPTLKKGISIGKKI